MSRGAALSQAQRSFHNPLVLGNFSTTSLRYLKGTLKAERRVIGSADTSFTSNGGYGGGTFNHWFQINLDKPGWIILTKGPPRPKYINVSAYDINHTPIIGQPIFDADSVESGIANNGEVYIPYLNTVMRGQSDLYNTYSRWRLDRGDDRYYPLAAGGYLICVSSTRNEPLDYELGVVIEFPVTEMFIAVEDEVAPDLLLQESSINYSFTVNVQTPVTTDQVISAVAEQPNGFTETLAQINSGVTVTVLSGSTWLIGILPSDQTNGYGILAEPGDDEYFNTIHDHSLDEWNEAWRSEHQDTEPLPSIFIPLTNRP